MLSLCLVLLSRGTQTWKAQQKVSAEMKTLAGSGSQAIQLCTSCSIKHFCAERWEEQVPYFSLLHVGLTEEGIFLLALTSLS